MATITQIMGMEFVVGTEPDFGSIRLTKTRYNGVNDYILKSADVNKLSSITNAADGATAICVDTADLYILHLGEWVQLGGESTENTVRTQAVNLSPLNISREELTESENLNENEELSEPDILTVEPIKGSEELI